MRQISEKTTVQVGLQVLEKLEALHEVGYLYNDLKPDNILVGNHDDHKLVQDELLRHLIDDLLSLYARYVNSYRYKMQNLSLIRLHQ